MVLTDGWGLSEKSIVILDGNGSPFFIMESGTGFRSLEGNEHKQPPNEIAFLKSNKGG